MKKRLFMIIMLISVGAVVLSCTVTTLVYHNFYVTDEKNELKSILLLKANRENWVNENKADRKSTRLNSSH